MPQGGSDELDSKGSNEGFILVVEDDARTLRLERFVLEEEGFTVVPAGSGEEALDILADGKPALVMLDIGLPGIDGFTTCERIRESSQVPIIMVTAEDRDEDKVRGLESGADDYVTKPFSTTELAARVKAVIRRYAMVRAPDGFKDTEPPPVDPDPLPLHEDPSPTPSDDEEIYEGTIKLAVQTSGSIRGMIQFVDSLRQSQEFHLLRLVADQNKNGMDIWLRLRGPVPLRETLLDMEGVTSVEPSEETLTDSEEGLLLVSLNA